MARWHNMSSGQISDQRKARTCSGTINRSATAVRGWIWPHRARCSPLHAFAAPFVHNTTPDHQSTKVGTSEFSADFRPNNSQRGLQQRVKVRIHHGGGKSVPEPPRLTGCGREIIIIGPDPRQPDGPILSSERISDQITISSCSGTLHRSSRAVWGSAHLYRVSLCPPLACSTLFAHQTLPDPR